MTGTGSNLLQLLDDARRWFEKALVAAMEQAGSEQVTPPQLALFAVLDAEGTTASELARRMGVTRQTTHQAVGALVEAGLVEQAPDPTSARRRLVRRTAEGERAHRQAMRVLRQAEDVLAERVGPAAATALRAALEADWGDPPPLTPPRR